MKMLKKVLKWAGIGVAGLAVALTSTVVVLERRTYEPPIPRITASADPGVIARGRYLAYGAAHCVDCHGDPTRAADRAAGKDIPFIGGIEFKLPIGIIRPPNITPDPETGIGALTDGQLARALRYGVRRDGRTLAPFMPFANLSDEDLRAIISFLRAQAPVRREVVTRALNPLGHTVAAFLLKPVGPTRPLVGRVPAEPTAAYGEYLVHSVANCVGCHTNRNMVDGSFVGPTLAGGLSMESETKKGQMFVTPNLTNHERTGRIFNWTEDLFLARFRTGKGAEHSPMPWQSFGTMTDDDLRAIYRYLKSVPGVENDTGDAVRVLAAN